MNAKTAPLLVVEDNNDILRLLDTTLTFKGYRVVTARNGSEALAAIEATALIVRAFSGALSDKLRNRKILAAAGYGMAAFTKPLFAIATVESLRKPHASALQSFRTKSPGLMR